jgi:hypothetical protein
VIGRILCVIEIAVLSGLILVTRCANYHDVFVGGKVYFADADCYARMTRVRMCAARPGLILRHHDFENFPQGTTPHTTAPLDYLILALALPLKPFTAESLDIAGACVSPLLALAAAWFLWWWSRQMKFRFGWAMLILFAISPILVHGTALGRPDHQSLLILLVTIGTCVQWSLQSLEGTCSARTSKPQSGQPAVGPCSSSGGIRESRIVWRLGACEITSAAAWAMAIWVSAYEPLILFLLMILLLLLIEKSAPHSGAATATARRAGWILFAVIITATILIERRVPSFAIFQSNEIFKNWGGTIGEMGHVSPTNPVWFRWCGYLVLVAPFLMWINVRARKDSAIGPPRGWTGCAVAPGRALPIYVLLVATYLLTIWQVRWAYFFVLIFALVLPAFLTPIKSSTAVWIAFLLSIFPILREWDETLWPNDAQVASRVEKRTESAQIRQLALTLASSELQPFLAPWWLSPSIAYWSGQPGVAGSAHESLKGIEDSAGFFLSDDLEQARSILQKDNVAWVFAYDSQRVTQNSAAILDAAVPRDPLGRLLDRTPSQAPAFLIFSAQTPVCKLYRVNIQR